MKRFTTGWNLTRILMLSLGIMGGIAAWDAHEPILLLPGAGFLLGGIMGWGCAAPQGCARGCAGCQPDHSCENQP